MKRKQESDHGEESNGVASKRRLVDEDITDRFRPHLFDEDVLREYCSEYAESTPYKHGTIPHLINDKLLRNVRDEIRANISFTPKETDIYKIHQSGDLANLDGLEDSSLKLLPSLVMLRDALYSAPFREYLSTITGSGPLSGSKTDMAVNVYTPGCHLLCHDDVIGSRKVSYILYLTDPDRPWSAEWGGALRLYPTEKMQEEDGSEAKVPTAEFTKVIPPAFGQLAYFAVQPGESFHDVEEVYHQRNVADVKDDGGRIRMAISGWYHLPQPGEEGYREGAEEEHAEQSSLAQLQGKANKYDLPKPEWISHTKKPALHSDRAAKLDTDDVELDESDLDFLLQFMNPRYLVPDTVAELAQAFTEESSLKLALFLSEKISSLLQPALLESDLEGTDLTAWKVARPPHKHRFLYKQPRSSSSGQDSTALCSLINEFFPSLAFKKWLSLATGLTLTTCNILARRFRRGLDYALATTYEEEDPRLEICLGLTPTKGWGEEELDTELEEEEREISNGSVDAKQPAIAPTGAELRLSTSDANGPEGGVGGYEVYMAGDEEDVDATDEDNERNGPQKQSSNTGAGRRREKADPAVYRAAGGADEDDGLLFSMPAAWNTLSIVLRDEGVLRFVKYVSESAPGDRWDITAEFNVEPQLSDDEEDAERDEEGEDLEEEDTDDD